MLKTLPVANSVGVPKTRSALSGSTWLFAAVMLVNILNYGYALVLGRFLGPVEYGQYASYISLFLLVGLLPLTLQQVVTKYSAEGQQVLGYALRLALLVGAVLGGLLMVFAVPLGALVSLPASWLLGLGLLMPAYAVLGSLRGEVQGQQKLPLLGSNMVAETGGKILLTPLVFLIMPGASGAVLATLAALPLTLLQLKAYVTRQLVTPELRAGVRRYALPVFLGLAAQAIIINSDVLMVNALLPAEDAGLYAATALLGRVVFYGSWAVGAAVFPLVAARHKAGEAHLDLLFLALAVVGVVSLGVALVCALVPNLVITLLFGKAYLAAASLIAPYALITALYALANVVSNHYLALGSHRAGYLPLLGAGAQVVLLLLFHDSVLGTIWIQLWAKGGLLLLLVAAAAFGLLGPASHQTTKGGL